MKPKKKPLISLCMIVGNVEEYIDRCLTSFAPIADEIVVVRAIGNRTPDRTLEIAKDKFGAITGEYQNDSGKAGWPHVDSFAAARQASYDLATGEYCFWCDSDDVLEPGSAELIRKHAEDGEHGLFIFPYNIFGRGVVVPRERMMRRNMGKWKYPVHECFTFESPVEGVQDDRVVITHLPYSSKNGSNARNLRILESMDRSEMHAGLLYHLAGELICAGRKEDAMIACRDALASPDLGVPERYEIFLNLARMSDHPAKQTGYLNMAYQADPCRREALGMLACTAMDYDRPEKALAYARQMLATEPPQNESWNDRRDAYGWLGADIMQQALRVNGRLLEAEQVRQRVLSHGGGPLISLIHATRGRRQQAAMARKMWLDLAENPDAIEHLFVIDEDDDESSGLRRMHHMVMPAGGGCVAAWNAGAQNVAAPIMIQMSDDWIPPAKWDRLILDRFGDDLTTPRVLAVSDGHRTDNLLCMAICTRSYWALDHFLFHPAFKGVYSDDWFTREAYRRGAVIEARDLVFDHKHPAFTGEKMDATYAAQNSTTAYRHGQAVLERLEGGNDWSSVPGYFDYHAVYEYAAQRLQDGDTAVEIGSWMGRSVIFLAQRLKELGKNVKIKIVDTFAGELNQPEHQEIVAQHGGSLRSVVEANLARCGVADMVEIVEGDSAESAGLIADDSLAFCFIDAAHDYDSVVKDLAAWFPKVKAGGILAGHDYPWHEVQKAVDEHAAANRWEVAAEGRVWLKKP